MTRHVHIVEDEETIRRSMHLMLRVMGYQPAAFESGTAFLAELPEIPVGVVLLDLRMPEIDGLEVQRRLLSAGSDHSVIVMSGHGDLGVAVTAMEQGAMAFLEKPFPRAALAQALELAFLRLENPDEYHDRLRAAAGAVLQLETADRQVLELVARGHDSESIAQLTGLSAMEIEVARSRIFAELRAETVTEALQLAFAARRAATL